MSTPVIDQVRNNLRAIIDSIATLRDAAGAGRAFELYVMTGVGRALQVRGYDVWVQRSDGSRVRPTDSDRRFIQRGGAPTGIAAGMQGREHASSIAFRRGRRSAWELHNGIQFIGRSAASHEIDLAILPESVARTLRNSSNGGRPLGRPRIAIECKDVGIDGSVDEMRAFVARLYDLTILHAHHRHLDVSGAAPRVIHPGAPDERIHRPTITYWNENRRTLNVLARRTGFVRGSAALSGYFAVEPHARIAVGSNAATELMDRIADWLYGHGY